MARSVLTIWNQALSHVGSRNAIQSQTEQTREAQQLAAVWQPTYKAELEAFEWNFLTKFRTLALLAEDPPDSWLYTYQQPSDCLYFRYILPFSRTDDPIPFERGRGISGARVIFTDQENAVGCYSENVTDPNYWSAAFCNALSWKLAIDLVMAEIGNKRDALEVARIYEMEVAKAKAASANEEQRDPIRDSEGIRARE